MVCPKCGSYLQEDQLYCEKCGEEIQYVPEFQPEIEEQMQNAANINGEYIEEYSGEYSEKYSSTHAKGHSQDTYLDEEYAGEYLDEEYAEDEYLDEEYVEAYADDEYLEEEYADEYEEDEYLEDEYAEDEYLEDEYVDEYYEDEYYEDEYIDDEYDEYSDDYYLDEYEDEDEDDEDEEEESLLQRIKEFFSVPKNCVIFGISAVAVIAIIIVAVNVISAFSKKLVEDNSYTYQAAAAREAAIAGNYTDAILYMEKALALNSTDTLMKYELADYYFHNEENEKAILILWEIIYGQEEGYETAYHKMLDYYIRIADYGMVYDILKNCSLPSVISSYQNYLAESPEFSVGEGTYEDVVYLRLNSSSAGTIYYTTDGSLPTTESNVYTDAIPLELGRYSVSAFFVNSYGVKSEVSTKNYVIDIRVPDAPLCLLEEGSYTEPKLIEVEVQTFCTVYYTTDGTTPNRSSAEYVGPIPMPIGSSDFSFVAYSQEGIAGEVSHAHYDLLLDCQAPISDIVNSLRNYNYNMGKTTAVDGTMVGSASVYTYTVSSALRIDTQDYYILIENIVDSTGTSMKTGTVYLGNVRTGELFRSTKDPITGLPVQSETIAPELLNPPEPANIPQEEMPPTSEGET